jgi:predicted dehydrogenase
MTRPVVWGVLGTARIGTRKVIPAMLRSPLIQVRGIASRTMAVAEAAARELGIPNAYGDYAELIADPDIDAIYNPLPNHLHVPLTLAAARAGKHVLCEKPIALRADEARELLAVTDQVRIAEAFMVRHHPQWDRISALLRDGRIGTVRAVQSVFSFFNDDPADIRNQPGIGGGSLYDIGCYAVATARLIFEAEPLRAMALMDRDPQLGIDRTTSGLLDFGAGRQLSFTVSTQASPHQHLTILGTRGRIEVEIPFNAPHHLPRRIRIEDGAPGGGIVETLPEADQYQLMVENFSRTIRGEVAPFWGLDDAIAQMEVIDALFRSERSGAWEQVKNSSHKTR